MTPTSLTQLAAGSAAVDVGLTPAAQLTNRDGFASQLHNFSGLAPVSFRYGLTENLDLTATWGAGGAFGPLGGVQVGHRFKEVAGWKLGVLAGLGVNHQAGIVASSQPVLDAEGNPVLDENGQQTYTTTEDSYAALLLSPQLGFRGIRPLGANTQVVGAVRVSYAVPIILDGSPTVLNFVHVEPELGLLTSPVEGLTIGLGVGIGYPTLPTSVLAESWAFVPKLSVSYAFPLKK